jgi:hypothetical protein
MHNVVSRQFFVIGGAVLGLVLGLPATPSSSTIISSPQEQEKQSQEGGHDPLEEIAKQIAGQENKPAPEVFKNIRMFKGLPAGQIPRIMRIYTRALGVRCNHCHVPGEWDKDDKAPKLVAREMGAMVGEINGRLLKNIKELEQDNPRVGCFTCHRGEAKPEGNMPPPKQ